MKKLLAVVLALMLVLTLALPLAQADALEEITILYPGEETDEMSNFLKGAFAEKVAAELNMKVNFRFLSWDAYWDQKSVMLGANEAIDLYWDGLPDLSTMVNKKEAQPLDELLAKCWPESMKEIIPEARCLSKSPVRTSAKTSSFSISPRIMAAASVVIWQPSAP